MLGFGWGFQEGPVTSAEMIEQRSHTGLRLADVKITVRWPIQSDVDEVAKFGAMAEQAGVLCLSELGPVLIARKKEQAENSSTLARSQF